MAKTTSDIKNTRGKPGRPKLGAVGVMVRLRPAERAAVDAWRAEQDPQPSRPEALRRLAELGLKAGS